VQNDRLFYGHEYIRTLKESYPALCEGSSLNKIDENFHIGVVEMWSRFPFVGRDPQNRFQALGERDFAMQRNAWTTGADPSLQGMQRMGASSTYKGLAHLKPPCDLVLYSSLLWELQPITVIEFGSFQGGGALWFADQIESQGIPGEVHSFEYFIKCVHPTATHPRLHFHEADLRALDTLDRSLFTRLPHPWLVVDDAHANVEQLLRFLGEYLKSGDYVVVEDIMLKPTAGMIAEWVELTNELSLLVDTKYTDAFGYNVTCSPNSWFRKI